MCFLEFFPRTTHITVVDSAQDSHPALRMSHDLRSLERSKNPRLHRRRMYDVGGGGAVVSVKEEVEPKHPSLPHDPGRSESLPITSSNWSSVKIWRVWRVPGETEEVDKGGVVVGRTQILPGERNGMFSPTAVAVFTAIFMTLVTRASPDPPFSFASAPSIFPRPHFRTSTGSDLASAKGGGKPQSGSRTEDYCPSSCRRYLSVFLHTTAPRDLAGSFFLTVRKWNKGSFGGGVVGAPVPEPTRRCWADRLAIYMYLAKTPCINKHGDTRARIFSGTQIKHPGRVYCRRVPLTKDGAPGRKKSRPLRVACAPGASFLFLVLPLLRHRRQVLTTLTFSHDTMCRPRNDIILPTATILAICKNSPRTSCCPRVCSSQFVLTASCHIATYKMGKKRQPFRRYSQLRLWRKSWGIEKDRAYHGIYQQLFRILLTTITHVRHTSGTVTSSIPRNESAAGTPKHFSYKGRYVPRKQRRGMLLRYFRELVRVKRGEYGAALKRMGVENGRSPRKPDNQRHRPARLSIENNQEELHWESSPIRISETGKKGRGKREISEKTGRPAASSGMIPTCEKPGATLPEIAPGSPRWEAISLTIIPPWPQYFLRFYVNALFFHVVLSLNWRVKNNIHLKIQCSNYVPRCARSEVSLERRRNARSGETGDTRENPPTSGIVRNFKVSLDGKARWCSGETTGVVFGRTRVRFPVRRTLGWVLTTGNGRFLAASRSSKSRIDLTFDEPYLKPYLLTHRDAWILNASDKVHNEEEAETNHGFIEMHVCKSSRPWIQHNMRRALTDMEDGMPFKSAARQFNVPVMALKRRHKGKNMFAVKDVKTLGRKKCVFSDDQEELKAVQDKRVRARAFNRLVVNKLFLLLREVNDNTVHDSNCTIFAKKGRKHVGRVVSAERGSSSTAVVYMSAGGNFISLMSIFNMKRMKQKLQNGAPPGRVFSCNDSGWMRLEVFSQWFDHFLAHVKPTEDDPALLILDGHLSNMIDEVRKHFVTILFLPRHCTHKLQAFDGVVFQLSHYHDKALENWDGKPSWDSGEELGIVPYNPDVFTDIDFAAAETTAQAAPDEPNVPDDPDVSDESDVPGEPFVPDESKEKPMRVIEGNMERRRNEGEGETGDP
ncbi:hypothetical protein PR048_008183 [Dryococelus australis]|uniref:DDE-1 domain-containing protein n=1 Tax=Dryococelus australis TaxID=614101 RepID=A0ABQ9HWD4_9NEOP|nr:hypothetical protein PR048_008183 [Dryococelus australis]